MLFFWNINLLATDERTNQISEALHFDCFASEMSFPPQLPILYNINYVIRGPHSAQYVIRRHINEMGFIQILVRNISLLIESMTIPLDGKMTSFIDRIFAMRSRGLNFVMEKIYLYRNLITKNYKLMKYKIFLTYIVLW